MPLTTSCGRDRRLTRARRRNEGCTSVRLPIGALAGPRVFSGYAGPVMDAQKAVAAILEAYDSGELSHGDVVERLLAQLDRDNIAYVLRIVPAEWRQPLVEDMRHLAKTLSREELSTIEAGIFEWESASDAGCREAMRAAHEETLALKRERLWSITLPAVRWWLQQGEGKLGDAVD